MTFSRAEMRALLSHIVAAREGVPRGALGEIQALAEGNPLFAEELLRHVIETERTLGSPIKLSETPADATRRAPLLGEHTEEVLTEFGFSEDEIAELLGMQLPPPVGGGR